MPQLLIHAYEEHGLEQKKALIRDVTATVVKAAGAAADDVGVFFLNLACSDRGLAGRLACEFPDPSGMTEEGRADVEKLPCLLVQLQMFEGRSLDQKRALAKGITDDVARHFKVDPGRVQLIISEMNRIDNASGGVLAIDKK
ncbi:tautomerase family protein [Desulfovibrio sp. OttesenSCG-928-C06]|nr:tautomerase family protein [Desulfovibrio sp. OttesenSCG-928-C06]